MKLEVSVPCLSTLHELLHNSHWDWYAIPAHFVRLPLFLSTIARISAIIKHYNITIIRNTFHFSAFIKKKCSLYCFYFHICNFFYLNHFSYNFSFNIGFVGRYTELTSGCVIGTKCEVTCQEVIPENTIIYGSNCERRVQAEKSAVSVISV